MVNEENKKMIEVYKKIVNLLNEKNNISRYEYFLLGGVSFKRGSYIVYDLFRKKQITLQEYNTLRNYIKRQLQIGTVSNDKKLILGAFYQFGHYVITEEEKYHIWNSLCELINEADIDDLVFAGAVRAYALKNGLIKQDKNQKKLIKRK